MATRFYLPISGAAAVSPTFGGGTVWNRTTEAGRWRCVTAKSSTALTTKTLPESAGANKLANQYVSDPIGAQTITGTCKGIILCREGTTLMNACVQMLAYVVSNDGATVRGQLIAFDNAALSNEFTTTLTNRKFPRNWSGDGASVTSVDAQANDRIVLEFGHRWSVFDESSTTIRFGDAGSTDCAEDETSTTDNVPWFEFSQDLFGAAATPNPPWPQRIYQRRA